MFVVVAVCNRTGLLLLLCVTGQVCCCCCVYQEQTTRKLKQETYAQLSAKQQKLDMLRNIINQDSDNGNTRMCTAAVYDGVMASVL